MELEQNFESNGPTYQARSVYLKDELSQRVFTSPKQLHSQIIALLAVNILSVEVGLCLGFIKIIVTYLNDDTNSDIHVTVDEITWISSIWFLTLALGYTIHGFAFKFFGRRQILLCLSIPLPIEWILIYNATNPKTFIIGLALLGLNCGTVLGPITMYTIEISKSNKDVFLSLRLLAMGLGTFVEILISYFFEWKITTFVNFGVPIMSFIALLFIPESPHWLASQSRLDESEKSLCWLRGWANAEQVNPEFRYICKMHAKPGYPVGVDRATISRDDSFRDKTFLEIIQPYLKRTFWAPLILLFIIFFIKAFGGSVVTQTFSTIIFGQLKPPMDLNLASLISSSIEFIACVLSILITHFFGKRMLTLISLFILCIFCFLLALYCSVMNDDMFLRSGTYISFFLLIGIAFLSQIGISTIPLVLPTEIFPMNTRDIGISLTNTFGYCFIFFANKIFMYTVDDVELTCVFAFFGVVNLTGCVLLYFILLEFKGMSPLEIARHFENGSDRRIDSKKTKEDFVEATSASIDTPEKMFRTKLKSIMLLRK